MYACVNVCTYLLLLLPAEVFFVTLGKSLGACPGAFGGVFSLFVECNCRAWPGKFAICHSAICGTLARAANDIAVSLVKPPINNKHDYMQIHVYIHAIYICI